MACFVCVANVIVPCQLAWQERQDLCFRRRKVAGERENSEDADPHTGISGQKQTVNPCPI